MGEFLLGIAAIVGVAYGGAAITEFAKAMGKRMSGGDAKQILKELKALREEMTLLRGGDAYRGAGTTSTHSGATGRDIVSRLDRLQEDVTSLRDTTTKFDMSFDASLDRLEHRMDFIETRSAAAAKSADSGSEGARVAARK